MSETNENNDDWISNEWMGNDWIAFASTMFLGFLPLVYAIYKMFSQRAVEQLDDTITSTDSSDVTNKSTDSNELDDPMFPPARESAFSVPDGHAATSAGLARAKELLVPMLDENEIEDIENQEEPPLERPIILRETESDEEEEEDEENLSVIPEEQEDQDSNPSGSQGVSDNLSEEDMYKLNKKKLHGKVATARIRAETRRMMRNMTDNEREQEEEVVNQQLESILRLLQENQENVGMSEEDVKQQLNMYKF